MISHCPKGPCWKETGQWLQEPGLECQESAHVSGGLSFSESDRKDFRTPLSEVAPGIQVILSSPRTGLLFPVEEFRVQVQALSFKLNETLDKMSRRGCRLQSPGIFCLASPVL